MKRVEQFSVQNANICEVCNLAFSTHPEARYHQRAVCLLVLAPK